MTDLTRIEQRFRAINPVPDESDPPMPAKSTTSTLLALEENPSLNRNQLTYNTYHVIKGFKDALESMRFSQELVETIKEKAFFRNARSLIEPAATVTMHGAEGSSPRARRSAGSSSHDSR